MLEEAAWEHDLKRLELGYDENFRLQRVLAICTPASRGKVKAWAYMRQHGRQTCPKRDDVAGASWCYRVHVLSSVVRGSRVWPWDVMSERGPANG